MDLRAPPANPVVATPRASRAVPVLAALAAAGWALAAAAWWSAAPTPAGADPELLRTVAGKLAAADQLDAAAEQYARYLRESPAPQDHGAIAYQLGERYLEAGRTEDALRWLYESETVGGAPDDVGARIVHALEALGRPQQAAAALASRSALGGDPQRPEDDPVVAEIGERTLTASQVRRALDDLPPELAPAFAGPDGPAAFLQHLAAQELLADKARRLELGKEPDVRRRVESARRDVLVGAYLEREVLAALHVDETDLRTWYQAHADRYVKDGAPVPFEQARAAVEQEVRAAKAQEALDAALRAELTGGAVTLHPERLAP